MNKHQVRIRSRRSDHDSALGIHTYNNAGHAFQNFLAERYRERASRASWTEMLAFFAEHLKRGATG